MQSAEHHWGWRPASSSLLYTPGSKRQLRFLSGSEVHGAKVPMQIYYRGRCEPSRRLGALRTVQPIPAEHQARAGSLRACWINGSYLHFYCEYYRKEYGTDFKTLGDAVIKKKPKILWPASHFRKCCEHIYASRPRPWGNRTIIGFLIGPSRKFPPSHSLLYRCILCFIKAREKN